MNAVQKYRLDLANAGRERTVAEAKQGYDACEDIMDSMKLETYRYLKNITVSAVDQIVSDSGSSAGNVRRRLGMLLVYGRAKFGE